MGCDIHAFVEAKRFGDWRHVYRPEKEAGSWIDNYYFPTDRDYDWFAVLANVRNGYGFAGCDTGDGFIPIADPKGLPEDVSVMVKAESDKWDSDGHSHSWITLKELQAYDWDRETRKRGVIPAEEYDKLGYGNAPKEWSGWVSGPGIVVVPHDDYEHLKKTGDLSPSAKYYVQTDWSLKYRDRFKHYFDKHLPRLAELAELYGGPENVRVVFWFDN